MNKTAFDNNLTGFNRRSTSNKTNHLKVRKKLNSLIIKDYIFFLSIIYLTKNDRSQNTFNYQPTLDVLVLKKTKALIMLLVGNEMEYLNLNVSYYVLLSWIA